MSERRWGRAGRGGKARIEPRKGGQNEISGRRRLEEDGRRGRRKRRKGGREGRREAG